MKGLKRHIGPVEGGRGCFFRYGGKGVLGVLGVEFVGGGGGCFDDDKDADGS